MVESLSNYGIQNEQAVTDTNGVVLGHYYTIRGGNGGIYIPANISDVSAVVTCLPGCADYGPHVSGTGTTQYSEYINEILSGNAPDYIVCFNYDDSTPGLSLDVVNAAINNGANITNVGVMDFSWSGQAGMMMGGQVSAQYPNMDVRIANIDAALLDAYNQHVASMQSGNTHSSLDPIRANIDNQVLVVSIIPDECGWENEQEYLHQVQVLGENGHNSYLILSNASSHGEFKRNL